MLYSNFNLYSHWLSCISFFFNFRFLKFDKEWIDFFLSAIVHSIFANTVNIYTHYTIYTYIYYMHSRLTAPITKAQADAEAKQMTNDTTSFVQKVWLIPMNHVAEVVEGKCHAPHLHAQFNPRLPHRHLYIEGDSICSWIPCKESAGWVKETYSIKQGRVFRGYLLVVQWVGLALQCLFPNLLHFCCCCAWGVPKNGQMRWWSWF